MAPQSFGSKEGSYSEELYRGSGHHRTVWEILTFLGHREGERWKTMKVVRESRRGGLEGSVDRNSSRTSEVDFVTCLTTFHGQNPRV